MYLPGFDPETKSDEELASLLSELYGKAAFLMRMSNGSDAIGQLRMMIDSVTAVIMDRAQQRLFTERMKVQKAVVESDPDAVAPKKSKLGGKNTERKPVPQRMVVMRSNKPTNQIQIDPTKDT